MNVPEQTIVAIEEACEQCSLTRLQSLTPIRRTLTLARGMQTIRKHLVGPLMSDIRALADTPLGFLTDRGPGAMAKDGKPLKPYDDETVRDCVIEGMLRGASIIGNELNIIARRTYLTKQYFERQLREWPGLTELSIVEGVPTTSAAAGGALVPMRATWKLNGVPCELICEHTSAGDFRIPVRVNAMMGVDATLGKAKRKLYAKIFARITGSQWVAEQADLDAPTLDVQSTPTPPTEPAAEPPRTADDSEAKKLFASIEGLLEALDLVTDVDQFEKQAAEMMTTDGDRMTLAEWCDWRREQIRDTRGERSNGKE
jgi:hypothetical protein